MYESLNQNGDSAEESSIMMWKGIMQLKHLILPVHQHPSIFGPTRNPILGYESLKSNYF